MHGSIINQVSAFYQIMVNSDAEASQLLRSWVTGEVPACPDLLGFRVTSRHRGRPERFLRSSPPMGQLELATFANISAHVALVTGKIHDSEIHRILIMALAGRF
jgi:hypothetical protein